jgi:hypothetical protein
MRLLVKVAAWESVKHRDVLDVVRTLAMSRVLQEDS